MELCFLRCHIEVNKHVSVKESAIFSYKFAWIGSHHLWLLYFHPECFDKNARAVLSQIEENKRSFRWKLDLKLVTTHA